MTAINALVFIVGIASAADTYAPLSGGALGMVANVEGDDMGSFKPKECGANCEIPSEEISLEFCQKKCTGTDGCLSFAHCTSSKSANFKRCYMKNADFSVMPHGTGDCTTYTGEGKALNTTGMVAVEEGNGLFSYKAAECEGSCELTDSKLITLDFCQTKCKDSADCLSFAHCTGNNGDVNFKRCYTKDRDFGVKPHAGGCTTYFKQADVASRLYSMIPKIGAAVQIGAAAFGGVAGLAAVTLLTKRVLRRGASEGEESLVDDEDVE